MIIDKLENIKAYNIVNNRLMAGFDFLLNNRIEEYPDGKYSIDGDRVFALISTYVTKKETEKLFEAHKKYIDIQYLVDGAEIIYWSLFENLTKNAEYSEQKDIVFLEGENLTGLSLTKNCFCIFYPQDAHKPGCISGKPEKVKKAVVKVLI
ncbi:MAG: DUF386 family protein [Spirochaeta sp.]|nr:DUF386 family protein [Spirochaeta sp.]